ncbi:MAG: DUF2723 domain-containing protein [Ardenticatenaceae bacterium]|nr:DUF2723 domain-containing protein [Ardenticatenaceae bacterium]
MAANFANFTILRHKILPPIVVFVVALLIYFVTIVPDLTLAFYSGDGGELITAVVTGGIPHPPGYPTYLLLGHFAALLPVEPIAYRFSLFSAFCGAIAAGITSATGYSLGLKGWRSALPGLTLAFIPLVWQQSVVTEVYALNLAMVSLLLWSLFGKLPYWLVGFFLGASLTTHLTSIFLLPFALLLVPVKAWPRLGIGFLLGLTPFLALPWLAHPDSPVVWSRPDTLAGWWWLVSAQIYQPNQLSLPVENLLPRLKSWSLIILQQLLFVGWLFLPWNAKQESQKKQWWMFVGTAVIYILYAFFYNTEDALVLTLPAWLLLSLSLTATFNRLGQWGFLLPLALVLLNFTSINRVEVHKVRPYAEQILHSSPPDAVLITSGDPDIFALWYFHFVEKQRPDVILVDDQLFAFKWYRERLHSLFPNLHGLENDDLFTFRALNVSQRPVCTVVLVDEMGLLANNSCSKEP